MPTPPLTDAQLAEALAGLPGWTVKDGELTATYRAERGRIPAFYADVATAEDKADHHARITILYGTITFALNTHDAGGALTAKDTKMATRVTQLATEHGASVAT
ncbi:4a-hydroxytetrahydrobiopterin dehydratase [Streptomyces sp. NPDC058001]|uniref:4a-hydroxytetrahydrobiopterin dehydratase n=1 Tax=Streptomyces sp. NPDC058001 TaxID=3346300 RepID=UPI0036EAB2AD